MEMIDWSNTNTEVGYIRKSKKVQLTLNVQAKYKTGAEINVYST